MEFTGERFISDFNLGIEMETEHYHRYMSVEPFVRGKVVLDAACGSGYGSYMLSKHALKVYGIDISQETIDFAKKNFISNKLSFFRNSIEKIELENQSVDVVVSFETIEHVDESIQHAFIKEIKRILKPDGVLIVSTPNKQVYSDLRSYSNEFHVKEFYEQEFIDFLSNYFVHINNYHQGFHLSSVISDFNNDLRILDPHFRNKGSRYFITVCSDVEKINNTFLNSVQLNLQNYYNSNNTELYSFVNKIKEIKQVLYLDHGEGFSEESKIDPAFYEFNENKFKTKFIIPEFSKRFRWDPIEGDMTKILVNKVKFVTGQEVIELDPTDLESNGIKKEGYYDFFTVDPFFMFKNFPQNLKSVEFEGEFFELTDHDIEEHINNLYKVNYNHEQKKVEAENLISKLKIENADIRNQFLNTIENQNKVIQEQKNLIISQDMELTKITEEIHVLSEKLETMSGNYYNLQEIYNNTRNELNGIKSSKFWRFINIFRK